jgi:HAUS augmin-like complex subunit 1
MSHLPPPTAIFSPSVARIAASTARDWNYIDSWLSAKFHGHKPPAFERSTEALKALLALAALNEQADEERDLVARAEAAALQELKSHPHFTAPQQEIASTTAETRADAILTALEHSLTKDGKSALDAMASLAVQMGAAYPEPEHLAQRLVNMQGRSFALQQDAGRTEVMQRFLANEVQKTQFLLAEVAGHSYRPPSDLAKRNLDMQRKIRTATAGAGGHPDSFLAGSGDGNSPITVENLAKQEEQYFAALAEKKELDSQVALFQGLSHDADHARAELEALRADLRRLTRRKDAVFESLVEGDTPRRGGR